MANNNQGGLRRVGQAAIYSFQGIRAAWQHEAAFRQECALCVVMIPLAFWLGVTAIERALLIGVCLLVLITELLNSALEAVVDRIGDEPHVLSGRAKDMGSAAVFFSLLTAGVVWVLLVWQRFFS